MLNTGSILAFSIDSLAKIKLFARYMGWCLGACGAASLRNDESCCYKHCQIYLALLCWRYENTWICIPVPHVMLRLSLPPPSFSFQSPCCMLCWNSLQYHLMSLIFLFSLLLSKSSDCSIYDDLWSNIIAKNHKRGNLVKTSKVRSQKKTDIIWEFFPNVGPPPFGNPLSKNFF